jgi:reversibly glycosylated polypeptide/UDP-arabinopyranose mutase
LQVRDKLGPLDAYFLKLADAMIVWIEAWQELNPQDGKAAAPGSVEAQKRGPINSSLIHANGAS